MCLGFSREISCLKTLDNNSSFRQEISFNLSGCGSVTVEQRDVSLEIAAIYHLATFSLLLRMIILLRPFISFPGKKRLANKIKTRYKKFDQNLNPVTGLGEFFLGYRFHQSKLFLLTLSLRLMLRYNENYSSKKTWQEHWSLGDTHKRERGREFESRHHTRYFLHFCVVKLNQGTGIADSY